MSTFSDVFGANGLTIDMDANYHGSFAYEFAFHVKDAEQDENKPRIILTGDITDIDSSGIAPTLAKRIVPKSTMEVEIIYDWIDRSMRLRRSPGGVSIEGIDNGKDSYIKLLSFISDNFVTPNILNR